MTDEFPPLLVASKAILAINADSPIGSDLCLAFAQKGSRILIHHEDSMPTACRLAMQVAAREAIALPLHMNLSAGEQAMQSLVDRIVDDFGRLDVVLYFTEVDSSDSSFAHASACAKAALPYLRQSRPAGHFMLIASMPAESGETTRCRQIEAKMHEFASSLSEEYAASKARACVNALLVPQSGLLLNEIARFAVQLSNLRGISGRSFCLNSLINIPTL